VVFWREVHPPKHHLRSKPSIFIRQPSIINAGASP
jgi:hypothetical protein